MYYFVLKAVFLFYKSERRISVIKAEPFFFFFLFFWSRFSSIAYLAVVKYYQEECGQHLEIICIYPYYWEGKLLNNVFSLDLVGLLSIVCVARL